MGKYDLTDIVDHVARYHGYAYTGLLMEFGAVLERADENPTDPDVLKDLAVLAMLILARIESRAKEEA